MKISYELEKANTQDQERLLKYKLASILDYAFDLEKEERDKIIHYVQQTMPKQIENYQVIKVDHHTVGCLCLEKYKDGVLLNEIYLEEDYRGKGIGTQIISNILHTYSNVYLWVYQTNKGAFHLYQTLGFKIKETTESRYFMEYSS